jgi:hypothetical protein
MMAAFRVHGSWIVQALHSAYYRDHTGSDTVLRAFERVSRLAGTSGEFRLGTLAGRGYALAGFGRLRESRAVADTLAAMSPEWAAGLLGEPALMGLAPPPSTPLFDSIYSTIPAGARRDYVGALRAVARKDFGEARRVIDAALAERDTVRLPGRMRGLLVATRGWGELLEGDSVAGIRRLREGLATAAAPGQEAEYETSFLRFQLALGLAARAETRQEGIQRLRNGFDLQSLYIPLSFLALGQAWEAAGERDSAAFAYGRFLQLWDKPDPELQWRVAEAREGLQRLTAEPRQ